MRYIIPALLLLFATANDCHAQHFDARRGPIFDQAFVTRISTEKAEAMTGIADADKQFQSYLSQLGSARDARMPAGIQRHAATLTFRVAGRPALSLTDYHYRGKTDAIDSQHFSYLATTAQFHILAVRFTHDRPCFMLVEKSGLKVYFIDYPASDSREATLQPARP